MLYTTAFKPLEIDDYVVHFRNMRSIHPQTPLQPILMAEINGKVMAEIIYLNLLNFPDSLFNIRKAGADKIVFCWENATSLNEDLDSNDLNALGEQSIFRELGLIQTKLTLLLADSKGVDFFDLPYSIENNMVIWDDIVFDVDKSESKISLAESSFNKLFQIVNDDIDLVVKKYMQGYKKITGLDISEEKAYFDCRRTLLRGLVENNACVVSDHFACHHIEWAIQESNAKSFFDCFYKRHFENIDGTLKSFISDGLKTFFNLIVHQNNEDFLFFLNKHNLEISGHITDIKILSMLISQIILDPAPIEPDFCNFIGLLLKPKNCELVLNEKERLFIDSIKRIKSSFGNET